MEEEKRPLHSPEHFEKAVDRITKHEGDKDALWWLEVDRLGRELQDSVEGGTVDKEKEDGLKERMADFMNKENYEEEYKSALGDTANLWWEDNEEK